MDNLEKTNENLISVIIPVYNGEKYLSECLDSVLNQTYQNLEIIIVNDGSTDNTQNIIDNYAKKDSRISKIVFETQKGVATARNTAVDNAKGGFLAFVDSDDYINDDYLEMLLNQMSDSDDIVCCGYNSIQDDTVEKYALKNKELKNAESAYLFYLESRAIDYTMQVIWGKLFRREIVADKRFELLRYGEDTLFIIQMITSGAIIKLIDYVGYNYMEHTDSLVNSSQRKTKEYFQSMLEVRYLSYNLVKDISERVKDESAEYYKKEVLDVALRLKKWYCDKHSFKQNSKVVREHIGRVKKLTKLSFRDLVFLYAYAYCPRLAWLIVW